MRSPFIYTLLFIIMLQVSCKEYNKKNVPPSFRTLSWKVSGHLPDNPDGALSAAAGIAGPVTGVSHGRLLVGGGSNFPDKAPWEGGQKKYHRQMYIYERVDDSLQWVQPATPVELPYQVAYSANCSMDQGLVMAGGENESGPLSKVLLLNWDVQNKKLQIEYLPDLPFAVTAGMLTAVGNTLYFAGGNGTDGTSDAFLKLNLDRLGKGSQGWQELPSLPQPTAYGVLYGLDSLGQIYLVGGRKSNTGAPSDLYPSVYQFDLSGNQWTEKSPLPYALSAQTGVTFNQQTLMVFSGDKGKVFHQTELLLLQIASTKDPQEKADLIQKKNKLQASHPGFTGTVLAYQIPQDKWKAVDTIPFPGQVTTSAVMWEHQVVIPCGEIRAGIRSADIVTGNFD